MVVLRPPFYVAVLHCTVLYCTVGLCHQYLVRAILCRRWYAMARPEPLCSRGSG